MRIVGKQQLRRIFFPIDRRQKKTPAILRRVHHVFQQPNVQVVVDLRPHRLRQPLTLEIEDGARRFPGRCLEDLSRSIIREPEDCGLKELVDLRSLGQQCQAPFLLGRRRNQLHRPIALKDRAGELAVDLAI